MSTLFGNKRTPALRSDFLAIDVPRLSIFAKLQQVTNTCGVVAVAAPSELAALVHAGLPRGTGGIADLAADGDTFGIR